MYENCRCHAGVQPFISIYKKRCDFFWHSVYQEIVSEKLDPMLGEFKEGKHD